MEIPAKKIISTIEKILKKEAKKLRKKKALKLTTFLVGQAGEQLSYVRIKAKIAKKQQHELKNGILYLKGGDLTEELQHFPNAKLFNLTDYFDNEFFETKKVVHIPLKKK